MPIDRSDREITTMAIAWHEGKLSVTTLRDAIQERIDKDQLVREKLVHSALERLFREKPEVAVAVFIALLRRYNARVVCVDATGVVVDVPDENTDDLLSLLTKLGFPGVTKAG